jgi:ribokinase
MRTRAKLFLVPSPPVKVVDSTCAGDPLNAGLIDALLNNAGAEEMLRRAASCGALSTRAAGALNGLPTCRELEDVLWETAK